MLSTTSSPRSTSTSRATRTSSSSNVALTSASRTVQVGAKRLIDVVGAIVMLVVLLPVFLIVAILVRRSSPGPVFFRQARMGYGGRVFRIHKFRTMFHNADPAPHQAYYQALVNGTAQPVDGKYKLADDPRVTPIGRILRRFSLDELPQLLDVISGEMSLVGPRPPLSYEVELYDARERRRLTVKPGLTGLWQVSGRSSLAFQGMVDLDLYYIEHWSLWLDLEILLRTPLTVLRGKGV